MKVIQELQDVFWAAWNQNTTASWAIVIFLTLFILFLCGAFLNDWWTARQKEKKLEVAWKNNRDLRDFRKRKKDEE